jgi:hypothetical protein
MEKYQRGKVYAIVCRKTGRRYVGSTCEPNLARRLSQHVVDFKRAKKYITSFDIIKDGDYYIVLLESYPCNSKDELRMCEQKHIDSCECVNQVKAFQSEEEWKQYQKQYMLKYSKQYRAEHCDEILKYQKQYREENHDELNEKANQYRKEHRDEINEKANQYREEHRDELNEKAKQYYEQNRDEINAKKREKVCCPRCQTESSKSHIARHLKTCKVKLLQDV